MDEYFEEQEAQRSQSNSSGSSPLRKYLKRRRAQVINLPPLEDDEDRDSSESESVVEDAAPLPNTVEHRQRVSVKQVLGDLFTPASLAPTTADR